MSRIPSPRLSSLLLSQPRLSAYSPRMALGWMLNNSNKRYLANHAAGVVTNKDVIEKSPSVELLGNGQDQKVVYFWNEQAATATEPVVKADRAQDESIEQLQQETVHHVSSATHFDYDIRKEVSSFDETQETPRAPPVVGTHLETVSMSYYEDPWLQYSS